jgi:hypothetical protein
MVNTNIASISGIIAGLVLFLLGILNCFFGYKFFKVLLGVAGFIIGGYICGRIAYAINPTESFAIAVGVIGGIIIAVTAFIFYYAGIFLAGALLGLTVAVSLKLDFDNITNLALILVLVISGGILAVIFQKFMIIISTSFSGAFFVINSIFYTYNFFTGKHYDLEKHFAYIKTNNNLYLVIILISVILGIAGIIFQYRTDEEE